MIYAHSGGKQQHEISFLIEERLFVYNVVLLSDLGKAACDERCAASPNIYSCIANATILLTYCSIAAVVLIYAVVLLLVLLLVSVLLYTVYYNIFCSIATQVLIYTLVLPS